MADGLAPDERVARGLIMTGKVLVEEELATKPGMTIPADAAIRLRAAPREYASRGGEKLAFALDAFAIDVRFKIALDAGASTGGFTQCLLNRGAATVFAVDVGYGQLHSSLAVDKRVVVMERTNISDLSPSSFGANLPELCTADLSYLSLTKAVPILEAVIANQAPIICLIKPLFEGLRQDEMNSAAGLRRTLLPLLPKLDEVAQRRVTRCVSSPITGSRGAIEFLALLSQDGVCPAQDELVEQVIEQAAAQHGLDK